MRKLLLFPALLLTLAVFQSCSKHSTESMVAPVRTNVVNATIAPNGTYQLSIENSGNISISKQASHFQVSKTEPDSKVGFTVYKYIPAIDYRGTDEVVLSNTKTIRATASGGCSDNHSSTSETNIFSTSYTTVRINITD